MTDSPSASTRSRPRRLQFSLRLLLLAFTAFAIGFPIWYRWPYEETVFESPAGLTRRITTWQRQWGGGRLKHGVERLVSRRQTIETITYQNGLRNGPYESKNQTGERLLSGQFLGDFKEGLWTAPDRTTTWRRGKLHGPYELRLPPQRPPNSFRPRKVANPLATPSANSSAASTQPQPRVVHLVFADGRLTHFNGQPATNRLFDLLETELIDKLTMSELQKLTTLDVVEMPLRDTVLFLTEMHQIPIVIDPAVAPRADMPITGEYMGIDLCSALMLITAPQGLGCDYRYGCLWITTADDAKDWYDPTGVSEIEPPKDGVLARVWNEPASLNVVEMPLSKALDHLQERLAIRFDANRIQSLPAPPPPVQVQVGSGMITPPLPVTSPNKSLPFHHLLGQLLYQNRCRCRLEGETLIILPPENTSPQ